MVRTVSLYFSILVLCANNVVHAQIPVLERAANIRDAVLYDYDPETKLGAKIFGDAIADFEESSATRKRCSHGGPVCLQYANGEIACFYANTSGHNIDGWTEYAISKDRGETWQRYNPFHLSYRKYNETPTKPLWVEEGVVTANGTALLILSQFEENRRIQNYVIESKDHGRSWSTPVPLAKTVVGYPCAMVVYDNEIYVLFDSSKHILYGSKDDGKTWEKRSELPIRAEAIYGALCVKSNGDMLAGAYVEADEERLYFCVGKNGGTEWSSEQTAFLNERIRDPELAFLNGKYYLHGRSGDKGTGKDRFVIYQSADGSNWSRGTIVSNEKRRPDGYSHNCIISTMNGQASELMVMYSICYEDRMTSEYVFYIRPDATASR